MDFILNNRSHYFGAGPAALPHVIKQQIQTDILGYQDLPVSILELSHRSPEFTGILDKARAQLRDLYAIPDNYHVLFMAGGATAQFDAVPLNLLGDSKSATYIDTGFWSRKAASLANKYGAIHVTTGLEQRAGLSACMDPSQWDIKKDSDYVHITPNETIDGIELRNLGKHHTLVADMTSCLLMQSFDINDFGLIYCGAQKTVGIAGITIVIVRDDLLAQAMPQTPEMLSYAQHVKDHSIVNTAPVFACYVSQLMLAWTQDNGGVDVMSQQAQQRAHLLYAAIDEHPDLINTVHPNDRSNINVVFDFARAGACEEFMTRAAQSGLHGLQGHRLKGGVRASMYNGTPMHAVEQLREIMLSVA